MLLLKFCKTLFDVHLIHRVGSSDANALQLLFTSPLPLQVTSQPPHDYRDPRPRGYLGAAIVRRRCQEAPFSHLQRARLIIRWKSQNNLGHAWNRGNCYVYKGFFLSG